MHAPQSYEAAVELEEIAAIPHNIVTPRHARPLIGVFQDSLVGSFRLTRAGTTFTRREFMNLMMRNKRFDGVLPDAKEGGLYTGQQVLSQLLPPLNIEMGNKSYDSERDGKGSNNFVKIIQGDIQQGQVDGDIYMKPGKGIVHVMYNDYGATDTTMFLDSLQRVVEDYLVLNGFSVGISDLVADDATKESIVGIIKQRKREIEDIQTLVHSDLFENNTGKTNQQEFEDQAFSVLNKATQDAGKAVQESLSVENRLVAMIKSGSKGDPLNIAQMIACLGQQSIEGKRIQYGLTDRTLPHYKKYDDGAEARGFIESSFIRGLTPQEFFFHAMSGREGLIDTAVKTADTGYIQRQLIKALEDIVVQHDGTVRDANMNILQFFYGEDSITATKLETQGLPLSKMSRKDIRDTFGLSKVTDWSPILQEGIVREGEEAALATFVEDVLEDQQMLVEGVFQYSAFEGVINAPVNLPRLILNTTVRFGLKQTERTDLTPSYVLAAIPKLIERTNSKHVRIWGALLRYYLAPHNILVKERFTKTAFDALCEMIVVTHMKTWVQPGEQVGILAAQSIGEPSTQLTLNSVDWDERIVIARDGKIMTPMIGEFIDDYEKACDPARIQHMPNDQIYIDLKGDGHQWKAFSCDENGKAMWTTLEAITKHPVVNEDGTDTILEVELESGRTVKATKGKSFLTVVEGKLTATNGSDIKVGDELPCSVSLAMDQLGYVESLNLRSILPAKEWIYGTDVKRAMEVMAEENAKGNRHWFSANNGSLFTVPYNRSDSFRDAFINGHNPHSIQKDHVYPKFMRHRASQIPETLPLDAAFGFFCGAYLAEGMSNETQVNITNNDKAYLEKIATLMEKWHVGTHCVEEERECEETGIKGHTQSLVIHSTLLATVMTQVFGNKSYVKDIPDWVLQAPDEFVKALVDGYVSGDGCVSEKGSVIYSSVSEKLITKMNAIMARYGIFTTVSKRMPPLRNFKSVSMSYISYIGNYHTTKFAEQFTLTLPKKQERLQVHLYGGDHKFMRSTMGDIVLDKVKTIKEVRPLKGRVYDLTVESTRNFTMLNTVCQADTFHMAGVASKSNVTQGIPRLREILKVTKNPKATSLTIYMKPEFRQSKEKARELVQDLELTLLRTITNKVAIYWDPSDDDSVIEEDRQLLGFYREIEEVENKRSTQMWLLRLELNREEMYNKNISMADVVFVIQQMYPAEVNVVYSDYNADKLIMRIRIIKDEERGTDTAAILDDFTELKRFQNKLLNNCVIRGVPGIKAVTFRKDVNKVSLQGSEEKYTAIEQYILDTDGSNYTKVMNHPAVDANRLYTTNIYDVLDILGIEAVRAILMNELNPIFGTVGVNYRHLGILCDWITRTGRLMSIDRYGINKNDIGPLAKMSFEETAKIVLRAALFGEIDPVSGVSANIMAGQPFRGGTAFSQILLDDAMLEQLTRDRVAEPEEEQEQEGNINKLLDDDPLDPCHATHFQMNVKMPPSVIGLEEPDVELYAIDE